MEQEIKFQRSHHRNSNLAISSAFYIPLPIRENLQLNSHFSSFTLLSDHVIDTEIWPLKAIYPIITKRCTGHTPGNMHGL